MKHLVKYLSVVMLLATTVVLADCDYPDQYKECQTCGTTTFIPRPQGLYSYITQASFFNPWYYKCCDSTLDSCATYNLGFRYDQTFKGERIAQCLFGTDENGVLNFQGTFNSTDQVAGQSYVVADDYGLSSYSLGAVSFSPRIQNYNIDFAGRWELGHCNDCLEGLYFGLAATLTHSVWDLCYCNKTFNNGNNLGEGNFLDLGYDGTEAEAALKDIKTALEGQTSFGVLAQSPAKYGKFVLDGSQNKTALANIDLLLGYDFLRCDGYHLGLFFKTVAPTGNRSNPDTVFSPIIGNAHHWEVGGGLDAHWDMWSCDDQCFSLYLNGSVTHLFDDKQWRTFDFNNCCMSRNALLKVFDVITASGATAPAYTFNQLIRASDWTTRKVESSFDVMGDASLKLMYRSCGWAFGLGYNVYGRSEEKICQLNDICDKPQFMQTAAVGVKGYTDAYTNGAANNNIMPTYCVSTLTPTSDIPVVPASESFVLTDADINFVGAPRQIQHTVFGNIDYQWSDCENQPFVGLGGNCSFAQDGKCDVCTANQWGVWIHGGLTF